MVTPSNPIPIKFANQTRPNFDFELLYLEELISKELDHDIESHHRIEFFEILLITKGQGTHSVDFTDFEYQEGTIFTIRQNRIQRFTRNSISKGFLLIFTEDFLIRLYGRQEVARSFLLFNEQLRSPKLQLDTENFQLIRQIIEDIKKEYKSAQDPFSTGIIRSLLHVLLIHIYRIKAMGSITTAKSLSLLLDFQQLVENQFMITRKVDDYARQMAISSKSLNRITKTALNLTPKQLIHRITNTNIKNSLVNSQLQVSEIAHQSGFDEPSNFIKYFKKHVGTSPESFRRKFRS